MRIQHNIAAMNAYRNYNNNTSAVSKNLEKLSSGYKINRAGDDAAGLAISEKMRAQISGLEAASKNVKDGISLVKTAEGAMQEVQDMLNRMVTLATQSANGTYDNEVDRANLQKEVEQLKSEINRIADSSNFNGIKLLDGSLDADGRRATTETVFAGLTAGTNTMGTTGVVDAEGFGAPNANGKLELTGGDLATAAGVDLNKSDNSIRYHKDAAESGKTTFTVDLDGIDYEIATGTKLSGLIFGLDSGETPVTSDSTVTGTTNNCLFLVKDPGATTADNEAQKLTYDVTSSNGKITSEDIATSIMDAIEKNGGKVYIETSGDGERIEYTVTRDGNKLNFEMTDDGYAAAWAATEDASKSGNYFQGNFTFNVDYKTTAAITAQDLDGSGAAGDTEEERAANATEIAFKNAVSEVLKGNAATCNINEGTTPADTIYAQAYIRFDEGSATTADGYNKVTDYIADGKGFQFGDTYYVFAATDKTYSSDYADNVKVVDIRDLSNLTSTKLTAAAGSTTLAAAEDDLRTALTRLSVAANDNEMFDVQVGKIDGKDKYYLVLNERTTYDGDANLTQKNLGLENQIRTFSSATSTTTVTKEAGEALTLQIGDTSEDFNQLRVNIGDIHTDSLGIADLDISTQAGAQGAIDTIKNAINMVSSIRGTLGATQNRLEHTANNLSVMTENIQDAESTIRDTDIAEEMMAYTKNNILVQSAQAMLAQANQIPQGVLQLLG